MHALTRNPINRRLRNTSRWPSEDASRWVGVGVGAIVGLVSALVSTRVLKPGDWSILFGSEPLVLIACHAVCFVLSATFMASYVASGDFALMRMSSLTPVAIVGGYTAGIMYRLRVLRGIAVWSPLGWVVSLLVTVQPSIAFVMLCALGVAVIGAVVGLGQVFLDSMSTLAVSAGVWFALRLGRHAGVMAAGAGALVSAMIITMLGVVFVPGLFRCCGPVIFIVAVSVLDSRRTFFRSDAVRAVEDGAWAANPVEVV